MRAVVFDRYGPPEVLRIEEVPRPVPKDDQVLIKVHAAAVNRTDTGLRSAEYWVARVVSGLFRPKRKLRIPGSELAGKYRPVIERTYALEEVVEANRYVESGQKTGNVVLTIGEPGA